MNRISEKTVAHLRELAYSPDLSETKYRVEKEIGRGGMAVVYLARDTELNREVAIKVLHLTDVTATMVKLMLREAQVIARLEHPGIVPVHDVGTLPDGRVFYAMKLVRGRRLDQHAEAVKSGFDRLRIFLKICEAVAFAHASKVIHRDLKPENVMVGSFGEVLVMDWGVARLLIHDGSEESISSEAQSIQAAQEGGSKQVTEQGLIVGTRSYISPEQAAGSAQVEERSDIYSLGAILFFLCNGHAPTESLDPTKSKPAHFKRETVRRLEAIYTHAMSPNPLNRYATVEALAQDVSNLLDDKPVSAYRENIFEKTRRWASRNRFLLLLILAYLLMRVALIFFSRG
jgi:serine/threonine protein kinase